MFLFWSIYLLNEDYLPFLCPDCLGGPENSNNVWGLFQEMSARAWLRCRSQLMRIDGELTVREKNNEHAWATGSMIRFTDIVTPGRFLPTEQAVQHIHCSVFGKQTVRSVGKVMQSVQQTEISGVKWRQCKLLVRLIRSKSAVRCPIFFVTHSRFVWKEEWGGGGGKKY